MVAEQLVKKGIDSVSAHSLGHLGDDDPTHLDRAKRLGRIFCTQDQDFLQTARQDTSHNGIVFGHQYEATIGGWVKALVQLYDEIEAEESAGLVWFVQVK